MSDFKNVMKGGWHPKGKEGGKESWRGDFKGINQVAGWMGKGKTTESAESSHIARPLASLKDPSSFGPPPRNVNYHGGAALPNEITPQTSGWGAPLNKHQIASARAATATPPAQEAEQSQKAAPPPLPFRADSTGLKTDNLPPPPKHRDLRTATTSSPQQPSRPMPSLPPRVPSRQNTVEPPPPPYESATTAPTTKKSSTPILNQSAMNRLGNAGVSVPALGIGRSNGSNNASTVPNTSEGNPWKSEKSQISSPGLSELQSRFSRLNTSSSTTANNNATTSASPAATTPTATSPQPESQPQAPTWQQTRSALTTANSAYKDPTSVTLADAQSAAQTAQNAQKSANAFRERHNETITAAQTRASQLNKRYNMTGRLNKFLEDANNAHDQQQTQQQPLQSPPIPQHPNQQQQQQLPQVSSPPPPPQQQQQVTNVSELTASISRKPPPPPPPKKPASMQAPPPVPLGTRPNFG